MASVLIKSIGSQHLLRTDKFHYIQKYLGKPLQLQSIDWFDDGTVCCFTIRYLGNHIITIFPDKYSNDVEFEVTL